MKSKFKLQPVSRRTILKGAAATGALAALPSGTSFAAYTHTRKSLQGPNVTKDLDNYKKAVKAMLELPPSDPRNWYRNAMIHLMDCPHGNWWFLVWHRGYLGWFERTCRELCGDDTFALPFWDWTAETKVPDAFWDDVLDPSNSAFISNLGDFRSQIRPAMETYWNSLSAAQLQQQQTRGFSSFAQFWNIAEGQFSNGSGNGSAALTRGLTQASPDLNPTTVASVSISTINSITANTQYVTDTGGRALDTGMTSNHHGGVAGPQSVLEGQPHNNVHGNISGLMGRFLSPTDPVFFMHHGNIDRLWNVWTIKQKAAGLSTGVPAGLASQFNSEEFLFYVDENGGSPSKTTAGDYFEIGDFDYDYEIASGAPAEAPPLVASVVSDTASSGPLAAAFGIGRGTTADLKLGGTLANAVKSSAAPPLYAEVTIEAPAQAEGLFYDVYIHAKGQPVDLNPKSDNYAGGFSIFSSGVHMHGPKTFTVAISNAVDKLRAAGALNDTQDLQVTVAAVTASGDVPLTASGIDVQLQGVKITAN